MCVCVCVCVWMCVCVCPSLSCATEHFKKSAHLKRKQIRMTKCTCVQKKVLLLSFCVELDCLGTVRGRGGSLTSGSLTHTATCSRIHWSAPQSDSSKSDHYRSATLAVVWTSAEWLIHWTGCVAWLCRCCLSPWWWLFLRLRGFWKCSTNHSPPALPPPPSKCSR